MLKLSGLITTVLELLGVVRLFTVLYFSVRSSRSSAVTVRRGISKRSHEKIGDCEQSMELFVYKFKAKVDYYCRPFLYKL